MVYNIIPVLSNFIVVPFKDCQGTEIGVIEGGIAKKKAILKVMDGFVN
jgi:hypothetical protein